MLSIWVLNVGCITTCIAFINLCKNVLLIQFFFGKSWIFFQYMAILNCFFITCQIISTRTGYTLCWYVLEIMCTFITFSHAFSLLFPTSCIWQSYIIIQESLYNTVTIDATKALLSVTRAMLQHHWIKDIFLPRLYIGKCRVLQWWRELPWDSKRVMVAYLNRKPTIEQQFTNFIISFCLF